LGDVGSLDWRPNSRRGRARGGPHPRLAVLSGTAKSPPRQAVHGGVNTLGWPRRHHLDPPADGKLGHRCSSTLSTHWPRLATL